MKPVIIGVVPVLTILMLFSLTVAPSSDLVEGLRTDMWAKISDFERHRFVSTQLLEQFGKWGGWTPLAPTTVALAWLVAGCLTSPQRSVAELTAIGTLLMLFLGYYWVYILSP